MIELVRYHTMQPVPGKPGRYHSQKRVALVKPGTKYLHVVAIDATPSSGLRVWKVAKSEVKYMQPLMKGRKPYPMRRALKTFRAMGRTHGITKGAKKLIKEAAA